MARLFLQAELIKARLSGSGAAAGISGDSLPIALPFSQRPQLLREHGCRLSACPVDVGARALPNTSANGRGPALRTGALSCQSASIRARLRGREHLSAVKMVGE